MIPALENILHLPTWIGVAVMAVLMLSAAATGSFIRMVITLLKQEVPHFIEQHPLRIVEEEHPGHRATWIAGGVMLTSKVTGKAAVEVPVSTVRKMMEKRSDFVSRISMRFCRQLTPPAVHSDRQAGN